MRASLKPGLIALLLAFAGPASADVERGWQAFLDGDYVTALAELEPFAEAGDATAQYYLGVLYDHGEGVVRNYQTATAWYEKAAAQGHRDAQFNLGMIYYNGAGSAGDPGAVAQDKAAAARWLAPAADNEHPMASYLMCLLVDEGRWVERDLERALSLCRIAADSGIAGAQYNTGLLLAERSNEIASWREAYTWFLLAKRANYPGADQNLETVSRHLNEAEIAEARAAADAWTPTTPVN
ncbi:MAG TPA: tetratricopeptide repeat protein [Kiloniellales bacterium]